MKIIYSDNLISQNDIPTNTKSIFLAGPTPRSKTVVSWRLTAIDILEKYNFNGIVFIPERKEKLDDTIQWTPEEFEKLYLEQVEWENLTMINCSILIFWVPRNMNTFPALTTNVEFGRFVTSNKTVLYGRPDNAVFIKYLDWMYKKFNNNPIYNTLEDLLKAAIN